MESMGIQDVFLSLLSLWWIIPTRCLKLHYHIPPKQFNTIHSTTRIATIAIDQNILPLTANLHPGSKSSVTSYYRLFSRREPLNYSVYRAPPQYEPPVYATSMLILLNSLIFIVGQLFPAAITLTQRNSRYLIEKYPILKIGFLTSQFSHKDTMHFLTNMISLYNIGPRAESLLGDKTTLAIYILSGWFTNLISYQFQHETTTLGASSAIFGLVGAVATFYYSNRRKVKNADIVLRNIQQTLAINLIYGMMDKRINNLGHILGFTLGILFGFMLNPHTNAY